MNNRFANVKLSYTDDELESRASWDKCRTGSSPWIYWVSELYSVGRLYRQQAFYPAILPLYVYSDHGIHATSEFLEHEKVNSSNVHFTFNAERASCNDDVKKNIYLVRHPWISYRKKKNYKPLETAEGTLVFLSHSTSGMEWVETDRDGYIESLKELPAKYLPITLCMHMHDINKGHHLQYRKYGLPITTCGNTADINFVDEFYKLTTQFRYATSNTPGSQMYYCIEMGLPYFLFGEKPKLLNKSDSNIPLGIYEAKNTVAIEIANIEERLFREQRDNVSLEQKIFAEWMLGFGSEMSRVKFSFIIWKQFFINFANFAGRCLSFIKRRFMTLTRR